MTPRRSRRRNHEHRDREAAPSARTRNASAPAESTPDVVPPPPPTRAALVGDAFLVALGALLVRLIYLFLAARNDPFYAWSAKGFDQHVYQTWALAILDGDWLLKVARLFYYSPLYAYFLAPIYAVFGRQNFAAVHAIQAVLGAGVCGLFYLPARSWLSRRGAFIAAACFALAAPVLYYEQSLLHEGLMLALYVVFLAALRGAQRTPSPGWRRVGLFVAGAAIMLAAVGRGNALLVAAMTFGWILLAFAREGPWRRWRRWAWGGAGVFALGIFAVAGPLVVRNHAVSGQWKLGMGNGQVLFYLGNAIDAPGDFTYSPRFNEAHAQAKKEPGVYMRMFREDLRADPGRIAWGLARKTWFFWATRDLPDNLNFQLAQMMIAPLRWTPVQWSWLVPLGLVGLGLCWTQWRRWSLIWLFTLVFCASLVLIIPVGRYRAPVLIPMALLAGRALEWGALQWQRRRWEPLAVAVVAFFALTLALWPWGTPYVRANDYTNAAAAAMQSERPDLAHRVMDLALEHTPTDDPTYPHLLHRRLILAVQEQDAEAMLRATDAIWDRQAWRDIDTLVLGAKIYLQHGRADRAQQLLQVVLRNRPDHAEARALLASIRTSDQ